MTTPLPINVAATNWDADADKGAVEHRQWHDTLHDYSNKTSRTYVAGDFIHPSGYFEGTAVIPAAGRKYYGPFYFPRTVACDALGMSISTAATGGIIEVYHYLLSVDGTVITRQGTNPITSIATDTTGAKLGTFASPIIFQEGWRNWFLLRVTGGAPRWLSTNTYRNDFAYKQGALGGTAGVDLDTSSGALETYANSGVSDSSFARIAMRVA